MRIYDHEFSALDLRRRVGAMDQVAGIQCVQFDDGRARNARAARVHTGSGLDFTIALDRGMDIAHASHAGRALGWRATAGDVAPQYFEPEGARWLRSYFGGLLTTCGLTTVGAPPPGLVSAMTGDGLHGRIGNTPAENLQITQEWQGDHYVLAITGTLRDAALFGPNLTLTRTIATELGAHTIRIHDVVTNEGFRPAPLMILYHCNIGWPVLDEGTRFIAPTRMVTPRDATARDGIEHWQHMHGPAPDYAEKVYSHDMTAAGDGTVTTALVNTQNPPFGVYVRYRQDTLPRFMQWKQLGEQDYVCGLEPANCGVEGRHIQAARGQLQHIAPGESQTFDLEFGVISTPEMLTTIEANCAGIHTQLAE
ncbi:MAG: aldose 1-epimerase family protein [Candidatus Hydrogenedentota bacterium]